MLSCKSKEDPKPQIQPTYMDLDVVTGIDLYDDNGSPIGRWKSPNDKQGEILTFPNPSISTVSVFSLQKIVRIWLIYTDCLTDSVTVDIPGLSQDLDYEIAEIEEAQIMDISIPDFNNQVAIDFSNYGKGFYKIFYQIDNGTLYWQNIFIDPTASSLPTYESLDDFCN